MKHLLVTIQMPSLLTAMLPEAIGYSENCNQLFLQKKAGPKRSTKKALM